jgi:hypothetical protein
VFIVEKGDQKIMDKKCNVNLVGQHFFYSFLNIMMIKYLGDNNPLIDVFQLCLNHLRDHYFIHVCTNLTFEKNIQHDFFTKKY